MLDAACVLEYLHQYFPLGGFRLYSSHFVIACTPHLTIRFRGCFVFQARERTWTHTPLMFGFFLGGVWVVSFEWDFAAGLLILLLD